MDLNICSLGRSGAPGLAAWGRALAAKWAVRRRTALASTALAAAWLASGCAWAPGLTLGESLKRAPGPAEALVVSGDENAAAATLTPVTAGLIRQQRAARPSAVSPQLRELLGAGQAYRIAPLDVLGVVLWGHPEFSPSGASAAAGAGAGAAGGGAAAGAPLSGYPVDAEGRIQLPFLGLVPVAGLTTDELRVQLEQRLAELFKNPMLTVRVLSYRGQRVYVSGEVANKGLLAMDDVPMTLAEVIARAGGLTALGDPSAVAVTRGGRTVQVDLPQLVAAGISPTEVMLRSGDLVHVRSREDAKVFVLGEVPRSGPQLLRNGRLTLNEALGEAGGVNPGTGDPRQIYVIRHAAQDKVDVFHLDAHSAWSYALAEGFELQPRDVVYVDPVPLVNWNRVISLILPSAQAVTVTRAATTVAP